MTTPLHLPHAFVLLALRDNGRFAADRRAIDTGLAGAVLSNLVLTRSIDLQGNDVVPTRSATDVDPFLKPFVDDVDASGRRRSAKHWVRRFRSSELRSSVLGYLVAQNLVTAQPAKNFGLFPTTRYPSAGSEIERVLAARVQTVLDGTARPDEYTSSLVAVLDATGALKKRFEGVSKQRVKEITDGEWASAAVRNIIAQANEAVRAAVITTVVVNGSNN